MPRRKRGGCNFNSRQPKGIRKAKNFDKNKQFKSLQTRLMQISLTIDAHIYQSKKISTKKAREFLQELYTYKDQCPGDMRALQVIEKQTVIMKTIIQEVPKSGTNDDPVDIIEEDEDLLAIEQCAQNDYSMRDVSPPMSPILQCKSQPHVVENYCKIDLTKKINNAVLIDLTEDEFLQPIDLTMPVGHLENNNKNNALTKALSNLSLDDIEKQGDIIDDDMNSQSILDDFEVQIIKNKIENNIQSNRHENNSSVAQFDCDEVQSQSILEDNEINYIHKAIDQNFVGSRISKTTNELRVDNNTKTNVIGYSESKIIEKENTVNPNIQNVTNQTKEYKSTEQILPKKRKPRTRKNTSEKEKPIRKYNRKANPPTSDINVSTNIEASGLENTKLLVKNSKDTSVKKTKICNARTNKKTVIGKKSSCKVLDTNVEVAATNQAKATEIIITGNLTNSSNQNMTRNTQDNIKNESLENKVTKGNVLEKIKYVKSYEEDLSWVENIKYVRVVEKAEYCTIEGITDSFWNNVSYPGDFDENDYKF